MSFPQFLVDKNIITSQEKEQLTTKTIQEVEAFLHTKNITNSRILLLKSEYYRVPARHLNSDSIPPAFADLIPDKSIDFYKVVPLGESDGMLEIGFVKPDDIQAKEAVDFIAAKQKKSFKIYVVTSLDFESIIVRPTVSAQELSNEVGDVLTELESELTIETEGTETPSSDAEVSSAPITRIVATILRYAAEGNASDIHVEPLGEEVRVRFRIDGTMHTSLRLPINVHQSVVARIKVLANMKIDEKRKPQDGRFSARIDGHKIDFRVSTFPTYHGEKVVMRILDTGKHLLTLEKINMSPRNLDILKDAIKRPYGMVLICGPTGSGKSTTLYAMLNEINRDEKNVLSLEDPVEFSIAGVNQSSVRPEIGYNFANGLRTTLRQDPDVIMVGEIRDQETAKLAVQAALTGHLVLSTIHTNNAVGVIPRLIDMGVDPYLIAPTLICVVAQRLVKKLCPGSGRKLPIEGGIKQFIDNTFSDLPLEYRQAIHVPHFVYGAEPTSLCPKGTRGREAVVEVMRITKAIEKLILSDSDETKLYEAARADGMITMKEDALLKSFEQIIPYEEVNTL